MGRRGVCNRSPAERRAAQHGGKGSSLSSSASTRVAAARRADRSHDSAARYAPPRPQTQTRLRAAATRFLAAIWFSGVISSRSASISCGVRRSCATADAHLMGPIGPAHEPLTIDEPLTDGAYPPPLAGLRNGDGGAAEEPRRDPLTLPGLPGVARPWAGEAPPSLAGEPRSPEAAPSGPRAGLLATRSERRLRRDCGVAVSFSAVAVVDGVTERGLAAAAAACAALGDPLDTPDEDEAPEMVERRAAVADDSCFGVPTSISSGAALGGDTATESAGRGDSAAALGDDGAAAAGGGEAAAAAVAGDAGAEMGREPEAAFPGAPVLTRAGFFPTAPVDVEPAETLGEARGDEAGVACWAARGDPALPPLRGEAPRLPAEACRWSFEAAAAETRCLCACCAASVRGEAAARRMAAAGAPVGLPTAFPALRGLAAGDELDACLLNAPPAVRAEPPRGDGEAAAAGAGDVGEAGETERRAALGPASATLRAPAATAAALGVRWRCGDGDPGWAPAAGGELCSFARICATASATPGTGAVSTSPLRRPSAGAGAEAEAGAALASDSFPLVAPPLLPLPRSSCLRAPGVGTGDAGLGGDCGRVGAPAARTGLALRGGEARRSASYFARATSISVLRKLRVRVCVRCGRILPFFAALHQGISACMQRARHVFQVTHSERLQPGRLGEQAHFATLAITDPSEGSAACPSCPSPPPPPAPRRICSTVGSCSGFTGDVGGLPLRDGDEASERWKTNASRTAPVRGTELDRLKGAGEGGEAEGAAEGEPEEPPGRGIFGIPTVFPAEWRPKRDIFHSSACLSET